MGFAGSGHTLWQYGVPDKSGELTKSYASDFRVHGQEARKIRVLRQIEGAEDLLNLKTAMERSKSQQIREDRNFDRLPVSSWSDPSGRVVLLGDGMLLHSHSPCHKLGSLAKLFEQTSFYLFLSLITWQISRGHSELASFQSSQGCHCHDFKITLDFPIISVGKTLVWKQLNRVNLSV